MRTCTLGLLQCVTGSDVLNAVNTMVMWASVTLQTFDGRARANPAPRWLQGYIDRYVALQPTRDLFAIAKFLFNCW